MTQKSAYFFRPVREENIVKGVGRAIDGDIIVKQSFLYQGFYELVNCP